MSLFRLMAPRHSWLSVLLLLGCQGPGLGDAGTPVDAGAQVDAGSAFDAGASDAGTPDAGLHVDAGQPDAGAPPAPLLTLNLERDGGAVVMLVTVRDGHDAGLRISFGGVPAPVAELSHGHYAAVVLPPHPSGEYEVVASLEGSDAGVSRTAVVLPYVDDAWGQPELVPGLVNTPGTEDSSTISPDGQWLIVGTYSPVDILGCLQALGAGPADGRNTACQTSLGPVSGPARPRLPGASRVLSPSRILNVAPSLCASAPDGGDFEFLLPDAGVIVLPLAPVAAYGFKRQSDGSYGEPFVIGFDNDGVAGPFCFTFLGNPVNGVATLLYGNKRLDVQDDTVRPWLAQVLVGSDVSLGTYRCVGGNTLLTPLNTFPLAVSPENQMAGNTTIAGAYLVSDDESLPVSHTLAAPFLADGGIGAWQAMPLPEEGDDRRQPVLEAGRFYYYRNFDISSVALVAADLTQRSSFGAARSELAPERSASGPQSLRSGAIVGLGQPTFGHPPDGPTELYFVYYLRTVTGYDAQIGRVRKR